MTRPILPALAGLAAACLSPACSTSLGDGVDDDPVDQSSLIDDYVRGLPALPVDPPSRVASAPSPASREGDYSCTTTDVAETRQYDRVVAYAANSDSMWPGAMVAGESVQNGLFTQVVLDRAPLAFSVSLENIAGPRSGVMEHPSLSAFREQIGGILAADTTGATPANIYSEIEEVHSQEQLSLALGASASWLGSAASIAASFDWQDTQVRSRYLVRFTQAYYTIDIDQPGVPSDFLAPSVTIDDVTERAGPGNPPLYVSSITYGRMIVFTFESDYSAEELGAALSFVYEGGASVSGDVSVTYQDIVSSAKITAYILGGSGGEAARAVDSYDALVELIHSGGDYSRQSPGMPIAYKLAYLADNSPGRISLTEDYQVQDCVRVGQLIRATLTGIEVEDDGGDAGNDLEIYGQIWVGSADDGALLFDKSWADYLVIAQGSRWPGNGSSAAEAVIDVSPQPGQAITVGAELWDYDPTSYDDWLGTEEVDARFETGWRRDVDVLLTGDGARIKVTVHLEPI